MPFGSFWFLQRLDHRKEAEGTAVSGTLSSAGSPVASPYLHLPAYSCRPSGRENDQNVEANTLLCSQNCSSSCDLNESNDRIGVFQAESAVYFEIAAIED